ncbi:MAG: DUF4124 domain-containing protein [Candidatus Polarisedimenticolaceae bacterium]|nr:DUF4124 domain-containing protein [Candidatus Polarisedimenticolaceae bacterium]
MTTNGKTEELNVHHHTYYTVIFLLLTLVSSTLFADQFYRWQDANGNWHYTDTIPPEQIIKEHSKLDEQGLQVESIKRVKNAEELAKEAELEKLRAKQRLILERQQAEDRVLLRTFRSGDDIIMARDGKLRAVDLQIQLIESNIKRMKEKLAKMHQSAAESELSGLPLSAHQLKNIQITNESLKGAYASIIIRKQRKAAIHKKYNHDLQRFLEMHKMSSKQADDAFNEKGGELELQNVLKCGDDSHCQQAWSRAEQFVRLNATTQLQVIGDNIIMTAPPKLNTDISITISRIYDQKTSVTFLFMDLQCKESETGIDFCTSEKVGGIYSQFQGYLSGSLGSNSPPKPAD